MNPRTELAAGLWKHLATMPHSVLLSQLIMSQYLGDTLCELGAFSFLSHGNLPRTRPSIPSLLLYLSLFIFSDGVNCVSLGRSQTRGEEGIMTFRPLRSNGSGMASDLQARQLNCLQGI